MIATPELKSFATTKAPASQAEAAIARWDDDGGRNPIDLVALEQPPVDHVPVLPSYQNEIGVGTIRIGAVEFHCIGALPPGDHPHIYLNMSSKTSIRCPYCATDYVYDAALRRGETVPAGCAYNTGPECAWTDRSRGVHTGPDVPEAIIPHAFIGRS